MKINCWDVPALGIVCHRGRENDDSLRECLSVEDQQYAANALAGLDPRFGYCF